MEDKFLPIGSVVLLNDGTKKVMITGFCVSTADKPDDKYDYCGCLYPEGILKSDLTCVFNHDQINELFYLGFKNEEEEKFKLFLNNTIVEKKDENNSKTMISNSEVLLKLDEEDIGHL